MPREYNIAVIPGDGTGPEVVAEGIKVLEGLSHKYGLRLKFQTYPFGGGALFEKRGFVTG